VADCRAEYPYALDRGTFAKKESARGSLGRRGPGGGFAALRRGRYHGLDSARTVAMKVFGFAGFSGSGKTTLIERLIPIFTARGLRVSLVKHAHHTFDVDQPGKDSYRHRHAGATEVLVTSSRRWVLMHELRGEAEPSMEEIVARISPCDLLLVEGYKRAAIPKLEVYREAVGEGWLHPHDPHIVAIATDGRFEVPIPVLDLDRPQEIGEFILRHLGLYLQPVAAAARREADRR
jgi:molybdopterin-guanine dinucleotide biosynthesis protein B